MSRLFKRLGDRLGIRNMTPDEKLRDFTQKVVGKLLGGKPLVNEFSKNQNNNLSLQNISNNESANNNQTVLKRLLPAEEQGRNRSGEINALAATFLSRLHERIEGIYGQNSPELYAIADEEETYLEDFAKAIDVWVDDADTKFGNFFDKGQEQSVYIDDKDGNVTTVTKLNDGSLSANWLEFLDRLALHNTYFPQTAYTLKGFGKTKEGNFVAITEQPYIKPVPTTEAKVAEHMKERGFEPLSKYDDSIIDTVEEKRSFINKDTGVIVEDLHLKNVFQDESGNMFVIDPVISLDTEDRGYGGTREVNVNDKPQFMASAESLADLFPDLSYDRIDQIKTIVQRGQPREKLQALVDSLVANGQLGNEFLTAQEEADEIMRLYDYLDQPAPATEPVAPEPVPVTETEADEPEPATEKVKLPPPPPPITPTGEALSAEEDKAINRILNKRLDEYNYPNILFDENLVPINGEFKQETAITQSEKQEDRPVDGTYVKQSLEQLRDISLQTARELEDLLGRGWAEKTLTYLESGGGAKPAQAIGVLNVISTQIFNNLQSEDLSTKQYNDLRSQQKRVDLLTNDTSRQISLGLNMRRIYKIFADGGNINSAIAEQVLTPEVRKEIDALKASLSRPKTDAEINQASRPVTPTTNTKTSSSSKNMETAEELKKKFKDKVESMNTKGTDLMDRVKNVISSISKTKCP
jgi:hypothetical protein